MSRFIELNVLPENARATGAMAAAHAASTVSARYTFMPTSILVSEIEKNTDWVAVRKGESNVRNPLHLGFQKHFVKFRRRNDIEAFQRGTVDVGSIIPELTMVNAHNGLGSLEAHAGGERVVCKNGLIAPDSIIQSVRVRHTNQDMAKVLEIIQGFASQMDVVVGRVKVYRSIILDQDEVMAFAANAATIRSKYYTNRVVSESLLGVHRAEDSGENLWNVFNRVQENLIRGYAQVNGVRKGKAVITKSRAIASIPVSMGLNKDLWSLCEDFAQGNREIVEIESNN